MTRVLIVDDQTAFRHQLGRLLAYAGLTVVGEAGDIAEATTMVRRLQPDLAVIDVMLPGISGLEGTRRLKAMVPHLRVILVSAYDNRAGVFQTAAEEVGAEAFVSKQDLDLGIVQSWEGSDYKENQTS